MRYWLAAILFTLPLSAAAYVSPGNPDGFVNDFANVISAQAEAELEAMLASYEEQTGIEIAVATIPRLGDETVETYAVRLFEEWGIGKQGQDAGALFVAAIEDREMRIETGYGLEGDLTDAEAAHLLNNVIPPYFSQGDFDGGVRAGVVGILQAVGADFDAGALASGQSAFGAGSFIHQYFFLLIFVFIWFASVLARSRSWWGGGAVGAVGGIGTGIVSGAWLWLPILIAAGLGLDYLVSTKYRSVFLHKDGSSKSHFIFPWIFFMGGGPHRWDKGGGFGGFGGGLSGGGGASGRW